ncbi:hypothetical protein ERJ75_000895300 [Trypanosoma vivax]|nr:hypothetical protein ERJ75_000895300 [Trypanosoma vivax]
MDGCLTCSWLSPMPPLAVFSNIESAVAHVSSATQAIQRETSQKMDELPGAKVLGGSAPWLQIRSSVGKQITRIVLLCNGRVVEMHTGEAAVSTHEGEEVMASSAFGGKGSLFTHVIECSTAPLSEDIRLKFFARRPKDIISVPSIAIALVELPDAPKSTATVDGDVSQGVCGDYTALVARMDKMEMIFRMTSVAVMRRLGDLEQRLQVLEQRDGSL